MKKQLTLWINRLGSLRFTVLLLFLSIVLVFVGTLAQVDQSIWTVVRDYFRTPVAWIKLQIFFPRNLQIPGEFPFPGGWTLGLLLTINLLIAFTQKLGRKPYKIGLILIHVGILLLLIGEGVTGLYAEEGNMTISEKSWSNFTEDNRYVELAIIDKSDAEFDSVSVVPQKLLRRKRPVNDPGLPFTVIPQKFMSNSQLEREMVDGKQGWKAIPAREVGGAQSSSQIDMPSIHAKLVHEGKELGSFLFSTWFTTAQKITVGDTTYEVQLRFVRKYRPYKIHLEDFRFDRYEGTDIPKNFSSDVRVDDPEQQVDRKVHIWMNHPLRYRGETFYQASFKPDESGTVLQVVKNPGWLIPYLSCLLVTLGLLIHFIEHLARSLRRRRKGVKA